MFEGDDVHVALVSDLAFDAEYLGDLIDLASELLSVVSLLEQRRWGSLELRGFIRFMFKVFFLYYRNVFT